MNSADLIKQLSQRLETPKNEVEKRLDALTDILGGELNDGKTISVLNFGSFEVKKQNERINVHPSTGKRVIIPPKLVLKFKIATSLSKKIKSLKP